jgi:hypothetical protein
MAPSLASLNLSHFYSGERESIIHQRLFFLLLLLFLKKKDRDSILTQIFPSKGFKGNPLPRT